MDDDEEDDVCVMDEEKTTTTTTTMKDKDDTPANDSHLVTNYHTHVHCIISVVGMQAVTRFNSRLSRAMSKHRSDGKEVEGGAAHKVCKRITDYRHLVNTVKYIWCSQSQSDHHYHYANSLCPPIGVDEKIALTAALMETSQLYRLECWEYCKSTWRRMCEKVMHDGGSLQAYGCKFGRMPRWFKNMISEYEMVHDGTKAYKKYGEALAYCYDAYVSFPGMKWWQNDALSPDCGPSTSIF